MLKLLCIGIISSIVMIDYCACKISGEISREEEIKNSRIQKL